MPTSIVFNMINVNSQHRNATVGIGENAQSSWDSHSKNNFGTGEFIGGPSFQVNVINVLNDNDFIDSPIYDEDFKPALTNQV
ncbi:MULTISPECIES: spore germination protein [Paenibacillus]|uniref:Spore germination protein n=1 Tax=Paenibacillus whitsoniae TaxID=2496558 RepID=A0A430J5D6_9BACL|nr:spore germination protein [Paenibacillus whitsoniae]RTE02988.1 hypothetical protein EJQ19_28540 [Paenibacillus whitsoniae]